MLESLSSLQQKKGSDRELNFFKVFHHQVLTPSLTSEGGWQCGQAGPRPLIWSATGLHGTWMELKPQALCYKPFYDRNLLMFVIS